MAMRTENDLPTAAPLPRPHVVLALLSVAAVAAYLGFVHLPGTEDMTIFWIRWSELVAQHGLREGYRQAFTDYPPGVFILFWLANRLLAPVSQFLLVKSIIVLAAAAGVAVYGGWIRNLGWIVALVFALLLSSAILSYVDVLYLAPLFASLWAIQGRRLILSSFCFTVAIMLKWQPIIIAPFFVAYATGLTLDEVRSFRSWIPALLRLMIGAIGPLAVCLLLVEPAILWRAFTLATSHPALSLQALNVNWLIELALYAKQGGKHVYDVAASPGLSLTMRLAFYALYTAVFAAFVIRRRSFGELIWSACLAFLVYFLFNIGVHENHLFVPMVLAFLLPCAGRQKSETTITFLAIMANLNLLLFYGLEGGMLLKGWPMLVASGILAAVNSAFGIWCLVQTVRTAIPEGKAAWTRLGQPAHSPIL